MPEKREAFDMEQRFVANWPIDRLTDIVTFNRYKKDDGALMETVLLNEIGELGQYLIGSLIINIRNRGNRLAFEFEIESEDFISYAKSNSIDLAYSDYSLPVVTLIFHLATGATFDWIPKTVVKDPSFCLQHRFNIGFEFEDQVWSLIDCAATPNFVHLTPVYSKITNLTPEQWSMAPDPLNGFDEDEHKEFIQRLIDHYGAEIAKWSLAKFLSSPHFFPGVGSYSLSHILGVLFYARGVEPWMEVGEISLEPENIYMVLLDLWEKTFELLGEFAKTFSIFVYDKKQIKNFYYGILFAYRKRGTKAYSFKGVKYDSDNVFSLTKTKKSKVYTRCHKRVPSTIQQRENWSTMVVLPLTDTNLGVGNQSWHSKIDEKYLTVIPCNAFGTAKAIRENKKKVRNNPPKRNPLKKNPFKKNKPNKYQKLRNKLIQSIGKI